MNRWLNWRSKYGNGFWSWYSDEKTIYTKKGFFDENNVDVSSSCKSDAILTKLEISETFFEVIDALRFQINERFHADNLNIV